MQEKIVWATNEDGTIEYVPITKDLLQQSIEVMHKSFYINENVCVALGLPDHPECFPEIDVLLKNAATNGTSIAAVDKATGKVAGVAFNKIQEPGQSEFYFKHIKSCKSSVSKNIIQWMLDMDNVLDIYEQCKVQSMMEIMFVGIVPEFRKRGIAKKLFQVSIDVAKRMREGKAVRISIDDNALEITRPPEVVTAICTSFVTQKITKDLNFELATRVDFDRFTYDGICLRDKVPNSTRYLTHEYLRL